MGPFAIISVSDLDHRSQNYPSQPVLYILSGLFSREKALFVVNISKASENATVITGEVKVLHQPHRSKPLL